MLKAKIKDQLLACAIAFMWMHTSKTEKWYLWPKTASEAISECTFFHGGNVPQFSYQICVTRAVVVLGHYY